MPEKHYIITDTGPKVVVHDVLTFDELVKIAFPVPPTGQDPEITVSFEHAKSDPHHGDLAGGKVTVRKFGTTFDVHTNRSSPDLLRLRKDGYNIQVTKAGFLAMRDVPYVDYPQAAGGKLNRLQRLTHC